MNSISGFSKIFSKFYTIRYGLFEFLETYFRKHSLWLFLYVLEALVFQNTSKEIVLFFSRNILS